MKPELTARVIAKYESLDELTKSTILSVLCLVFRERVNECFKAPLQASLKGSVCFKKRTEAQLIRSLIQSILYSLYTAECD